MIGSGVVSGALLGAASSGLEQVVDFSIRLNLLHFAILSFFLIAIIDVFIINK